MNGLSCLQGLIGVANGCGTVTTPSSGLFVNDLPGISLKVADAAVNSEVESGVQLIEDKITYAENRMVQDIRTFIQPRMRARSVIETDTAGRYEDDLDPVALEVGKYKGILVELHSQEYYSFYLNTVNVKLDAVVTTNVLVINLMDGKIQDQFPVTTVADVPTPVVINTEYPVNRQLVQLLIAIDSGVAGTFDSNLFATTGHGCHDCSSRRGSVTDFSPVEILQASPFIKNNTVSINNTNGLSVDYSVNCSVTPYICNMGGVLAYPLRLRAGAEIMMELINSDRLNSIVTIKGAQNQELLETFEDQYEQSMQQILQNLSIPNDRCFRCTPAITKRAALVG